MAIASSQGGGRRGARVDYKPGSVPLRRCRSSGEDHSSRRRVAATLKHSHPGTASCLRRSFERAALDSTPIRACSGKGLPRRRSPGCRAWALTPRFQPYRASALRSPRRPFPCGGTALFGGVISVALSLGSPRVGVTDFPALWSPDFPPADGDCPPAIFRPPPAGNART